MIHFMKFAHAKKGVRIKFKLSTTTGVITDVEDAGCRVRIDDYHSDFWYDRRDFEQLFELETPRQITDTTILDWLDTL